MSVPKGYKRTEVGVIPEEWSVISLGALAELTSSKRIFESDYVVSGIPFFRGKEISDLIEGRTIEEPYYISEQRYAEISGRFGAPERGDILVTAVGTLGNIFVVGSECPFYFKDGNLIWLRRIVTADPCYVAIQLRRQKAEILNNAIGSSQKALTIVVLRNFRIPYAPLPEQRAIAEALGDVDALLGALDASIAKQRDLKQAAMQQLLTGQTRLPGFQGEWEQRKLRDIACLNRINVIPANSPTDTFVHFSLPAYDAGKVPVVELGALIESNKFGVPQNSVLLSKLNPRIPRVWAPSVIPSNAVASTEFLILTPNGETSRAFLYVLCGSPSFCEEMELSATGTTGSHQRISPGTALDIEVMTPPSREEQDAIASILSDMDTNLTALNSRRAKTAAIKQAMMQELLTGRTRLP